MLKLDGYLALGSSAITRSASLGVLAAGLLCGCSSSHSSSPVTVGTISTVAGDGHFGDAGNGGQATAAQFEIPLCVASDKSGNLYIGDVQMNTIRKVDAVSGVISDYAGNGVQGYSGDGGPATKASLYAPAVCTFDADGNLFIADVGNNIIRKITAATGIISTVAGRAYTTDPFNPAFSGDGGPATKAQLSNPHGIAVDSSGNIFISDQGNQRVREVNAASGIITTIAGTGETGSIGHGQATKLSLDAPDGLALDSSGSLYIVVNGWHSVAKLDLSKGALSIVAGVGTPNINNNLGDGGPATKARLAGPGGIAIDSADNLYISDNGNQRIRKITAATGIITTTAGTTLGYYGDGGSSTDAKLAHPSGIALDSANNLYIADMGNFVVRKVTY